MRQKTAGNADLDDVLVGKENLLLVTYKIIFTT